MSKEDGKTRSQRKAEKELLERTQRALRNEDARYLLRWVLEGTGIYDPAFTGNSGTFFNEGRREIGLEIISLLNQVDPYEYVRLMKEAADDIVTLRSEEERTDSDVA